MKTHKSIGIAVIVVALLIVGPFVMCAITAPKIDPHHIYESIDRASYLYDDEGEIIDRVFRDEDRTVVKYEDIPEELINAFVAIEDKTFWKHHGLNITRIFGAIIESLRGGSEISGTSTITQQLARNVYLPKIKSERSLKRKLIEIYYALEIERTLSKEEIMEAYLNTIFLGYGNYGIGSAAEVYFSARPEDLGIAECAALAALPQAPTTYALLTDNKDLGGKEVSDGVFVNDTSRERRRLVLELEKEQGYITEKQYEYATSQELCDIIKPDIERYNSNTSYFTDYVVATLEKDLQEELGISESEAANMIYCGGLDIHTTLDSVAQNTINKEFKDNSNFPATQSGEAIQAAMVITDVNTGAIKGMVGGRNQSGRMLFNRATSPRQPGSSIKPLSVYSAALQKSYELEQAGKKFAYRNYGTDFQGTQYWGDYITAGSTVIDEVMVRDHKQWPVNSNGEYTGTQTFRTALQNSINTCAVKIQQQVGNDYSIYMLEKYGISGIVKSSDGVTDYTPAALAVGGMVKGVTPLEAALAYAVFANNGKRYEPMCYTEVTDQNGITIVKNEPEFEQVLDPGVAWIMNDLLKDVVTKGTGTAARIDGIEVAGKTGTTENQADIWFDGCTASYSAALWIGTDHNSAMTSMSGPAAALWGEIISKVPDALIGHYPNQPDNVIELGGEYYTRGTQ